jgi:hypothetical protein
MRRYDFYTKNNLDNILKRDNATLDGNINKVTRHSIIHFICNCGEKYNKNSFYLFNKSGAFCKKCTSINQQIKAKVTFIKKYGVENPFQSPEIQQKIKEITLEKYGVEHVSQTPEFREKVKQTCIERYGVENPMLCDEIKDRLIQTNLEKYGVEHISQTQEFKDKSKQSCLERYGIEHVSQTPEFREKVKQAFIERYGVDNPNKTPEIREKIKQTNLDRYGVEHPSQNKEIQEKTQKNAKKYKEYKMPSGTIIKVQGYEPFALDELIKIYEETDIVTNRKDIPRISYTVEDKHKYYFPDIYIPSENKIIEVKSTWTYNCKEDNVQAKAEATKEAGYEYEIWIYNDKGNKTTI